MVRYLWVKKTAISFLSCSCLFWAASSAVAETVAEKIARTGKLTAGTSKDALPFAYRNDHGELVGYSIDILELITRQLEQEYQREIELELVALSPRERIPQLIKGQVDIVCDASSFTWKRDRLIDFSFSYSSTGTRLLTKKGNDFWDAESLANQKIGALAKTTNEQTIKRVQPLAEVVRVKDRAAGYRALQNDEIDAFASDGILLESWLRNIPNPEDFQIVGDYSREGIACMVAENNSQFLNTVNYSLIEFMQGFLDNQPQYVTLFDQWFGAQGVLPLTQDLRNIMIDNMQLLIDFKDQVVNSDVAK
ncbi:MAG: amino acid ABC transporter substrate-binding protein [Cyanobacteria bacterium P01_E01_bin.35]